ncbi:sugar kinase [Candidatus Bathyarchaeota archaeon]|nr:sugar kinase [Candidatus Bathyarchaeota archaeon]
MITLKPDVVALGEPMVEFCATGTGRLGKVELFKRGWGGDTSNFAVATARTGSSASHLCRLGDDEFGRSFMELWSSEGIDTEKVIIEPGAWTAIYLISLMEGGGHDFTYYRAGSAASRYSVEDLDLEYISNAKVFHTSGISLAVSETLREAAFKAIKYCRDNGAHITFDINMRHKLWPINTARAVLNYAFTLTDTVFASMEDMNLLYSITDPNDAAIYLRGVGVNTVVIKHGGRGCYVYSDSEEFISPGYKVDVLDTTGSGDAFDGAWVTATLERWPLRRRARFANAVGALTATGLGAVEPIPDRERALELMEEQG